MVKYIKYQISLFRWLTYIQVCRYYITEHAGTGVLRIRKTHPFWIFIYYFVWINTGIKFTYHFLTYQGWLLEVEFLDKMSIWVYFLIVGEIAMETLIFFWRAPLCEVLLASWKLQKELFTKLREPQEMSRRIHASDKLLVHIHAVIAVLGCCSILVQYYPAPKYALYTYAIIPFENNLLKGVFAAHEFIFIWHAWVNAASSVVLCEIFAVSNTHIVRALAKVAASLYMPRAVAKIKTPPPSPQLQPRQLPPAPSSETPRPSKASSAVFRYDIESLLFDYKKLYLASTQFNAWAGKWMGGAVGALYLQFVMDIFIMIQLLKEPGTGAMEVVFFFQDAAVGMFIMFWLLILLSRVWPGGNEFLHEVRSYLRVDMPRKRRKYLVKYQYTIKPITACLAGYRTTPESVPHGIHALINYYISAAMWQTPVDG